MVYVPTTHVTAYSLADSKEIQYTVPCMVDDGQIVGFKLRLRKTLEDGGHQEPYPVVFGEGEMPQQKYEFR
jgi:hypothetical protein